MLENDLCDKLMTCNKCKNKTAHASYDLSSYFILDVEYLHERKNLPIFQLSTNKQITFRTRFQEIPLDIKVKNEQLQLIGLISFEGDSEVESPETIVHYKTYIITPNRKWILFDGLLPDVQTIEKVPEDKIALLMYAKI